MSAKGMRTFSFHMTFQAEDADTADAWSQEMIRAYCGCDGSAGECQRPNWRASTTEELDADSDLKDEHEGSASRPARWRRAERRDDGLRQVHR